MTGKCSTSVAHDERRKRGRKPALGEAYLKFIEDEYAKNAAITVKPLLQLAREKFSVNGQLPEDFPEGTQITSKLLSLKLTSKKARFLAEHAI